MKKIKVILPALAFVFAVSGAFATMFAQSAWYDANGATAGGGTLGTITTPAGDTPECLVQSGTQCIIRVNNVNFNAYDTQAHAEARGTTGLLKFIPE
jgi:hypothetical protein